MLRYCVCFCSFIFLLPLSFQLVFFVPTFHSGELLMSERTKEPFVSLDSPTMQSAALSGGVLLREQGKKERKMYLRAPRLTSLSGSQYMWQDIRGKTLWNTREADPGAGASLPQTKHTGRKLLTSVSRVAGWLTHGLPAEGTLGSRQRKLLFWSGNRRTCLWFHVIGVWDKCLR